MYVNKTSYYCCNYYFLKRLFLAFFFFFFYFSQIHKSKNIFYWLYVGSLFVYVQNESDHILRKLNIITYISVTQPLYESRMYWVHDPAPPTSRRPILEFADTPAPAIAKESPGAPSTQPKHKKSRRRRRRKATRTANQNATLC